MQNIILGPFCDDKTTISQMILYTLGAQYEHKRKLRNKYLSFAEDEDDLILRNCLFKNQDSLLRFVSIIEKMNKFVNFFKN